MLYAKVIVAGLCDGALTACGTAPMASPEAPSASPTARETRPVWTATMPSTMPATMTPPPPRTATPEVDEPIVRDTPTPLVSTPQAEHAYRLREWTPDRARELINALRAYPDSLGLLDRGYHDLGYYGAFRYVSFAEQDALARFPESDFASGWIWDLAFNQAQRGDARALDAYARLIQDALQTGGADLDGLPKWFAAREPRLELTAEPAPDQPGQILTIADSWRASGGFLWVIGAGPAARVYPLHAQGDDSYYTDFDFTSAESVAVTWLDATGDGRQDLVTRHLWMPGSPNVLVENLDIFDVSVSPPQALTFAPALSREPSNSISANVGAGGSRTLQFDYSFDPMFCVSTYREVYQWDGQAYQRIERRFPTDAAVLAKDNPECADEMVTALLQQVRAGDWTQLAGIEALLTSWPYSDGTWWPDEDQAPDVRDRGRFVLGLLLALNGAAEPAQREIEQIVESPATADSRWVSPARAFLGVYANAADLPKACRAAAVCADLLAPSDLVKVAAMDTPRHPSILLNDLDLTALSTGEQDLDGDGDADQWLTLGDGVARAALWLFINRPDGRTPVSAGSAPANGRVTFTTPPPHELGPIVSPVTDEGVRYWRLTISDQKEDLTVVDVCQEAVMAERSASLRGIQRDDEALTADHLEAMDKHRQAVCPAQTTMYDDDDLAALRYAMAIASELVGDDEGAVRLYLSVWRDFPTSPFAWMGQVRLEQVP